MYYMLMLVLVGCAVPVNGHTLHSADSVLVVQATITDARHARTYSIGGCVRVNLHETRARARWRVRLESPHCRGVAAVIRSQL